MPRLFHSHFLDSGAFLLRNDAGAHDYRAHMDGYAAFVKQNQESIDLYANVDVIGDPVRSRNHLTYLEKEHRLRPVPVIHLFTDLKWLDRHLQDGYPVIALGGLASVKLTASCSRWVSSVFDRLERHSPRVRIHGFGVGGMRWITRFPWHSVDTVRWAHLGSRGYIPVPKVRKGRYDFTQDPNTVRAGNDPKEYKDHISRLSAAERSVVFGWLKSIGISEDDLSEPWSWYASHLRFYEAFRRSREGDKVPAPIIYYSRHGAGGGRPEDVLGDKANIMLAYGAMSAGRWAKLTGANVCPA